MIYNTTYHHENGRQMECSERSLSILYLDLLLFMKGYDIIYTHLFFNAPAVKALVVKLLSEWGTCVQKAAAGMNVNSCNH